jgi:lipoyl(octanoyl) transferase
MITRWLGRVPFEAGLRIQEECFTRCLLHGKETVLLLEHDPVYTIGRTPDRSSLGDPDKLPFPVFEINRGGQATFHGPGQLIGYPILDLHRRGRDLHRYLRTLEDLLIGFLTEYHLSASRIPGKTGVWVNSRKIASIGVGVRKWISMHGFALNVSRDLSGFGAITPCGLDGVVMTSISREAECLMSVSDAAQKIMPLLEERLAPDDPALVRH